VDYSQFGQALIVQRLITDDTPRVLVDIGASDGIQDSNSRALIEQGWRAVLVEPMAETFAKLRRNCEDYPQTTLVKAACSDRDGIAAMCVGGRWNSLSDSPEIAPGLGTDFVEVETITLDKVFEIGRVPQDFGVLMLDTEGLDLCVLKGLELTATRPRIIVTEDLRETSSEKYALLSSLCYRFVGAWRADSIWVSNSHPVETTSLRLPIFRLPFTWKPSGAPTSGTVFFDGLRRSCVLGWAFHERDQVPPRLVVVDLRGVNSPQRYVFQAVRTPRGDVVDHFHAPSLLMSGFRACIDVLPGEYELRVVQQDVSVYSEAVVAAMSVA
jgi:FkbM family methyltransferase